MHLLTLEVAAGEAFPAHDHDHHELLWAPSGVLEINVDQQRWVVPPTAALWIPAGMSHALISPRPTELHCLFEQPDRCPISWPTPTVLGVNALARELLRELGANHLHGGAQGRARLLLFELLQPHGHAALSLPMPTDARARTIADGILATPGDPRGLRDWAPVFGTSVRTLSRAFVDGTGLAFTQWRTHARLQASLLLLADHTPVQQVAGLVGYSTTGSFITAFRRHFGHTPTAHPT